MGCEIWVRECVHPGCARSTEMSSAPEASLGVYVGHSDAFYLNFKTCVQLPAPSRVLCPHFFFAPSVLEVLALGVYSCPWHICFPGQYLGKQSGASPL